MINTVNSKFSFVGIGIVAKDKPQFTYNIDVYPIESIPRAEGEVNEVKKDPVDNVNRQGDNESIVVNKGKVYTDVQWLPMFTPNRVTAPDVVAGEFVMLFQFAGMDEYFWTTLYIEQDIHKHETVNYMWSNKKEPGDPKTASYRFLVDTLRKKVHFHTDDNDEEACTYDMELFTKDGILRIKDGLGNFVELYSVDGILNVHINNDINVTHERDMVVTTGRDVTFHTTGNVTFNTKQNVTFNTDQDVTFNTQGKFTVNCPDITLNGEVKMG